MPLAKPLVFHQRSESPRSSGKVFKLRSEQEFHVKFRVKSATSMQSRLLQVVVSLTTISAASVSEENQASAGLFRDAIIFIQRFATHSEINNRRPNAASGIASSC